MHTRKHISNNLMYSNPKYNAKKPTYYINTKMNATAILNEQLKMSLTSQSLEFPV